MVQTYLDSDPIKDKLESSGEFRQTLVEGFRGWQFCTIEANLQSENSLRS